MDGGRPVAFSQRQGSGAKIRIEKTKAISNSGIGIGKPLSGIVLGLLSLLKTANRSSRPWLAGHLSLPKV